MFRIRRAVMPALLVSLALLSACGTEAVPSPSASASVAAAAPPSGEAGMVPIEMGQLASGTRYALNTDPVLSVAPDPGWGAGPAPGGIQLVKGQTIVRIVTGFDQAYVATGSLEPVGADADAIFAQVMRNARVATGDSGEAEIAGLPASYLDADAIYELNEEGGADIVALGASPLKLVDRFVNRVFIIDEAASPIIVVVSGPETSGLEEALGDADALLASMQVEDD